MTTDHWIPAAGRNTHSGGRAALFASILLPWALTTFVLATPSEVRGQAPSDAPELDTRLAIPFATFEGVDLKLDLYRPRRQTDSTPWPTIVWVHGGAWRAGSRERVPIKELTRHGFAIASVDYRLSPVARFPAQIHDIKAAIRFLKSRATEWQLDTERFVIAGASAGGHLAALTGVTNHHPELEGSVGEHDRESSEVHAIVSFYGASNLETILSQSTPHGLSVRVPALNLLLGGPPEQHAALARLASPVQHVDRNDPPLLLIHGDQDPQMPINQSIELQGRYADVARPVVFRVIHGGTHGGPGFYAPDVLQEVATFLKTHLSQHKSD